LNFGEIGIMQTQANDLNVLTNGAKLVGESVLPGASLLMDGQFLNGAAHAVVGIGARLALGPLAVILVCADSFSKSVTDKFLWDHVKDGIEARKAAKAAKAAQVETEAQAA
jgi:hypothetical protein